MSEPHDSIWVWIALAARWRGCEAGENRGGRAKRRLIQAKRARAGPGLAQGSSCGGREGTGVCLAVETTDLGMDPGCKIRWGRGIEEPRGSPGFVS